MTKLNHFRLLILLFILVSFFSLKTVSAQENDQEMVKKYNIKFPIAELGNCSSVSSCKDFCSNEANQETCTAFAKKKGFHKEIERPNSSTILKEAQKELGCLSETSCREICEKEENFEKCKAFAQKHRLGNPREHPGSKQILEKAKTILGCDSENSCKTVCENPDNQQKCSEFAQQTGLGGGIKRVGPGGCNSEQSCRAYCETHPEECRKFGDENHPRPQGAEKRGPGGCDSEESCKAGGFGSNQREPEDKAKMEQFCKDNPEKCQSNERPSQEGFEKRDEYCRNNPDKCKSFEQKNRQLENSFKQNFPPEDERQREDKPSEFSQPPQYENRPKEGDIEVKEEQKPQETDTANQQVQGISTEKSWWEQVISFFLP